MLSEPSRTGSRVLPMVWQRWQSPAGTPPFCYRGDLSNPLTAPEGNVVQECQFLKYAISFCFSASARGVTGRP